MPSQIEEQTASLDTESDLLMPLLIPAVHFLSSLLLPLILNRARSHPPRMDGVKYKLTINVPVEAEFNLLKNGGYTVRVGTRDETKIFDLQPKTVRDPVGQSTPGSP